MSVDIAFPKNKPAIHKPAWATLFQGSILEKILFSVAIIITGLGVVIGCLSLSMNTLEAFPVPLMIANCVYLLFLFLYLKSRKEVKEWRLVILAAVSALAALLLRIIPQFFYALSIDAIFHRSLISAILLLAISFPSLSLTLYYLLGATPRAKDLSYYPLILVPVATILAVYGILLYRVFAAGIPGFSLEMLIQSFAWHSYGVTVWENDWPRIINYEVHRVGINQFIMGTLLLILMTSIISLPIGMGIGLFVTEYANKTTASIVRFCTNSLRAISLFVLALLALSIVINSSSPVLSLIFRGFYFDENGIQQAGKGGSFILASLIISMLVIPILARATEEGLRSMPNDIKEGSLAVGASQTYTLLHVLIPWSLPNIVTGLVLGCAEAAGSTATIMFISGTSEYGINPFSQVTSLSYFIYTCFNANNMLIINNLRVYQYSAAIILILITLGLTIIAIFLKRRFSKRYRGI